MGEKRSEIVEGEKTLPEIVQIYEEAKRIDKRVFELTGKDSTAARRIVRSTLEAVFKTQRSGVADGDIFDQWDRLEGTL